MSQDAKGTAVAIAYIIVQDVDGYKEFIDKRIAGTPYFNKMLDIFTELKEANRAIKYIYTIRRTEAGGTEFVLDADYAIDQYAAGDTVKFIEAFGNEVSLSVMQTGKAHILPPTDSVYYGTLIGASAPIFDNGKVIGTVGVDIDMQTISDIMSDLLIQLLLVGLVIVLFSMAVLVKSSNLLLKDMMKDKLTNAYNKKYANKILHTGMQSAKKLKESYSILMLDLDHFKKINDSYGHVFGDVVLANVASVVLDSIRDCDNFIRYGGEEFIITVSKANIAQATELAERIRTNVEKHEIYDRSHNISVRVTVSIGVASMASDSCDPLMLIKTADDALYRAKENRNAVCAS
jgi:diguanylate cyclase (GGDEF)-like protein